MVATRAEHLAAAASHEAEGSLDAAERTYRALLASDGEDFEILLRLGAVRIALQDIDEGERLISRSANLVPESAASRAKLGVAYLSLRRVDDAIEEGRKALALDPRLVDAHLVLGSALQAARRHKDAVASYEAALAIDPHLAVARFNLATALQALGRYDEAIVQYESVLENDPSAADAHYGIGTALASSGRAEEAVTRFEQALAGDSEFVEASVALALALESLGRLAEAVPHYRNAIDVDPDYVDARVGLAKALAATGRYGNAIRTYDEAIVQYRHAASLAPDRADILYNLGGVLQWTGRLDEARETFERAIALEPESAASYLALTSMRPTTKGDPLLAQMERLVGGLAKLEKQDGPDAMMLHFALGKAYADIGEHERSFRHLLSANVLKRRTVVYNQTNILLGFDEIKRIFKPELLQDVVERGDPAMTPIFILGYPRSGSTLIEQMLASHRSVHGGGERKDFATAVALHGPGFPRERSLLTRDELQKLGSHYIATLMQDAPNVAWATDKMPGNFVFIGLIRLALPNARIIHTYRDPVDTCLSCFATLFEGDGLPFTYELAELGRHYHAYAELMEFWRRTLPPGAMLDVRYEDVVANFELEARRIVAYCGLPWDDACIAFHETRRVVQTASAVQVRRPIYKSSVGRPRPPSELLRPLLDALGSVDREQKR